ncbi:MAG: trehalose-phosphatase [Candidatus Acidiferrales bacterium]
MLVLNRQKSPADFWRRLSLSSERFLFLDYDGTIAPFDPDPSRAMADMGILARLQRLIDQTNTRVVIVTGRRARCLRRMIPLTPAPEIWGTQGIERLRPDGDYEQFPIRGEQLRRIAMAKASLRAAQVRGWLEQKPGSLAVHWRGLPITDMKRDLETTLAALSSEAGREGLRLVRFDGGVELRVARYTKATAVLGSLEDATADSTAAYLGDDEPDEDAFKVLRPQDMAILVRTELRKTAADLWMNSLQEVSDFLDAWFAACMKDAAIVGA